MKLRKLINALHGFIENSFVENPSKSMLVRSEIFHNVIEFIRTVYFVAGIPDLERRAQALEKIDTDAILYLIDILKKSENEILECTERPAYFDPSVVIEKMKSAINDIKGKEAQREVEIGLNLEMGWEKDLLMLLSLLPADSNVFELLHQKLIEKLNQVPDDDILLIWARLLTTYGTLESQQRFPHYQLIPSYFFSTNIDLDTKISRYAEFIGKYKPMIIRKILKETNGFFPLGEIAGISKVLAINSDGKVPNTLTNIEKLIMNLIPQVLALLSKVTGKTSEEILKNSDAEFFVKNTKYDAYLNLLQQKNDDHLKLLLSNMKRLTEYIEIYAVDKTSEIEKHLWQFKLGQEVIASEINNDNIPSELNLQKALSKFLIERGVLSFGRSFGRQEIDLYIEEYGEPFIIEVKLFKKKSGLDFRKNASQTLFYCDQLKTNADQLYSYMEEINQPRGVLVLFNYSDHYIDCPRQWIKGRLWILAINLGTTPSKTKATVSIKVATDSDKLFDASTI